MRINKTQQNATVCGELNSKQISAVAGLTAGGSLTGAFSPHNKGDCFVKLRWMLRTKLEYPTE